MREPRKPAGCGPCWAAALVVLLVFTGGDAVRASCHDRDEDHDGVNSCDDRCPDTPSGVKVDAHGCPCGQGDDDGDGITNCEDRCSGLDDHDDSDLDAVSDCEDLCPDTPRGVRVDAAGCPDDIVNWESVHVHPLELTPDRRLLLAVNTADARLEVLNAAGEFPESMASVPVGLDPVSVRAASAAEAWVLNRISGTASIVDLSSFNVVATLDLGGQPADVVFAGSPQRAWVSLPGRNEVRVFDPQDLQASPEVIALAGSKPSALATDGARVYVAFLVSGSRTTVLDHRKVSETDGPYAGVNPPPNRGASFWPPLRPGLPPPPAAGLVVRKRPDGRWMDDNSHDWSAKVDCDLADHDVAVIDVRTGEIRYVGGLLNHGMAIAVQPPGAVTVVGTQSMNQVRYEPNLRGTFVRAEIAFADPVRAAAFSIRDLNPQLDYSTFSIPLSQRELSVGDPRGLVWSPGGDRGFVTGMGSDSITILDRTGSRVGHLATVEGPTGLVLDPFRDRLYVLGRFNGEVATLDTVSLTEVGRIRFFDPTTGKVREGRKIFYNTHRTSGLGQASCASCHLNGGTDFQAWDLGDPQGEMKPFNQSCSGDIHPCQDWHPLKGPLVTQTLVGIMGSEPFHWRGDREGLSAFNRAFVTLLGADRELVPAELRSFTAFVSSLTPPANPARNRDGSLPPSLPEGGDPSHGAVLFSMAGRGCVSCHSLSDGSKPAIAAAGLLQSPQGMGIPHLLGLGEKTGFERDGPSLRGFGFSHDGSIDRLSRFLLDRGIDHSGRDAVRFPEGPQGLQEALDLEAFLLCFPTPTHPAVGMQVTLGREQGTEAVERLELMVQLLRTARLGMVARGFRDGVARGFHALPDGRFQSDRADEILSLEDLAGAAQPGNELTFTLVFSGTERRLGIDRDRDGRLDGDERAACSDPADPASIPGSDPIPPERCAPPEEPRFLRGDVAQDGVLDLSDAVAALSASFLGGSLGCSDAADVNDDGSLDISDPILILGHLFLGDAPPAPPFPHCGNDSSVDGLGCAEEIYCRLR